jgi:hypothetical protein
VQTEDSGREHPHIITHVFIDGRIIASRKSDYGARLGDADLNAVVKTLMQEQHKDVIRDLIHARLPGFEASAPAVRPTPVAPAAARPAAARPAPTAQATTRPVTRAVPRAPAAPAKPSPPAPVKPAATPARALPKAPARPVAKPQTTGSAFGKELISDRSLDDVILQFISEEISKPDDGEGKK